jgi:hypothetical protein
VAAKVPRVTGEVKTKRLSYMGDQRLVPQTSSTSTGADVAIVVL